VRMNARHLEMQQFLLPKAEFGPASSPAYP
jgi:hypothetical protein